MFGFASIAQWFARHEPTSAETMILIKEAINHLSPEHKAELKLFVAQLDAVDAIVDSTIKPALQ